MTGYQGGDVVATDTGSSGVAAGIIRKADGSGVVDVIAKEKDAEVIERRRVERICGEDRRGVTDVDVVVVSGELKGYRNRRAKGQLGHSGLDSGSIESGSTTHCGIESDMIGRWVGPERRVGVESGG